MNKVIFLIGFFAIILVSSDVVSQTVSGQRLTESEQQALGEPKSVMRRSDSREQKVEWVRQNAKIPKALDGESVVSVIEKIKQAGGKVITHNDDHIIASGAAEDFFAEFQFVYRFEDDRFTVMDLYTDEDQ